MTILKEPSCDVRKLSSLVSCYVPEADMESNFGAELSFVLPSKASSQFPKLFSILDESKQELGICGYGASVTTMEEVFLKCVTLLN